ncbi:MAG: type II toxin-antitoxin system ParD family antitoxin [Thermoguttaceae bacterium]
MHVVIPREFEPFVARVVENGEFRDESAVVREALRLLEKREQFRAAARAGVEQLDRGEYTEYDEDSLEQFLKDIRQEQERL